MTTERARVGYYMQISLVYPATRVPGYPKYATTCAYINNIL